jgi:signal transduction histidine kinase
MHRAVVEGLLCVNERAELRQRVENLRDSRSAMLAVEASELRRIERDLHDGAQQRLVMLAIDLSLASDRIETDPAGARSLMNDAREQARQALAELRDLVRGAAPAILLDRGLVAALGSSRAVCPPASVNPTRWSAPLTSSWRRR